MKKITPLFALIVLIVSFAASGQKSGSLLMKTLTHSETGQTIEKSKGSVDFEPVFSHPVLSGKDVNINWSLTEPAAVGSKIKVSGTTGQTFMSWWLNDERVSLYENTAVANWEVPIDTDWEFPIDLTPDGSWAATAFDTAAQVYMNSSSSVFWETIRPGAIIGVKLSPDGSNLYLARNEGTDSYVEAFSVGQTDPLWSVPFVGNGVAFNCSGDGSTLVFCQYTGINKMWVIDAETGDVLFDSFYKNQNPPALSYDGSIVLNGDYSGNVFLYQFDATNNTYTEEWTYKVGGGGTSVWVVGMGVSGDGLTAAVGTLIFMGNGTYEGEIYLFNSWSPVPIWIFQGAGDEVCSIDFSFDGSLMAAAGWGPLDHSKPDFWLFRKESSVPIFSINTLGSFNSVDLSDDGILCSVTGKAVHNREFGNGGLLYNVDSDPDGGSLEGSIVLENASSNANAKIFIHELDDYYAYSREDGSYEMKYIPAGTYTVTATKIGYYPITNEDVDIVEGAPTTLGFTLLETANPPYELFATQGAGLTVNLNWMSDNAQDFEGFNIYRKHIEGDLFPEEPLATVDNGTFSYEDADLIPLRTYFYAVTGILEEGVETPYSNIREGYMSQGFVTDEMDAYVGSTPVVDGTISPGEWDDAFLLDASDFLGKYDNTPNPVGSVTMYLKTNEAQTELYVACINENDTELEDHDEVALYVDDNNDGSYPPPEDLSEGNYWAAYYATGNVIRYRPIYNTGGVGEVILLENPQIEVSDATGVIVYEFVIPLGSEEPWQIQPNAQDQSGLFSFTLDDPTAFDGYWPCWNQEIFVPLDYGVVTFGAEDLAPPAPEDLELTWIANDGVDLTLEWSPPDINDFDHFNVYLQEMGGDWQLIGSTIGRQFFHTTYTDYGELYVTTVDHGGQESEPSETAAYFSVGIQNVPDQSVARIFPNPSKGRISCDTNVQEKGIYTVTVKNVQGQTIKTLYSGFIAEGIHTYQWDLVGSQGINLTGGLLFVHISGPALNFVTKVLVLQE
jgi:hypothetical protein